MDCSPEYVENYHCDEESSKIIICHGFDKGGLFDISNKKLIENINVKKMESVLSDEKNNITGDDSQQSAVVASVGSQKSVVAKFLFHPTPAVIKKKHEQIKRLCSAKRMWQRKLKHLEKNEFEFEQKQKERQENIVPMLKEIDEVKAKIQVLKEDINNFEYDINEENEATNSKINAVKTLQKLFEDHKVSNFHNNIFCENV